MSGQNSLSAEDIQELLDAHNMFRGMVDPPGNNIQRLVGSRALYNDIYNSNNFLLFKYAQAFYTMYLHGVLYMFMHKLRTSANITSIIQWQSWHY